MKESSNQEELKELKTAAKKEVTKLSSAGLIYKFYGKEALNHIAEGYGKKLTQEQVEWMYKKLYKSFIMEIDAIDNGVKIAEETKYEMRSDLSSQVGLFNKPWNAPKSSMSQHARFKKAMKLCEMTLCHKVYEQVQSIIPAFEGVKAAWEKRKEVHASGEVMFLD